MKGHTRRHGKGWAYVVDIGPDPATGKRRRKWKGGFPLERDARDELNVVLTRLAEGHDPVGSGKMTVRSFINDEWLPSRESRVKGNTLDSYRQCLDGRVLPRIGAVELRKLKPRHISDLYADLLANGGRNEKRGKALSARTVNYTGKVLTRALDDAVRLGRIPTNPAKLVERPRPVDKQMVTWDAEEARTFLAGVADDRLFALWALLLTTGLRRGEALGRRWSDLDLDRGTLSVQATLVARAGKPEWSDDGKTGTARRLVALDPEVVAVLRAHRTRQREERLAIGPGYRDEELVFCTVTGGVLHPDNVTRAFDRRVKNAGLRRIRLHDLRHTAATLLLKDGVPLKVVSERLGHSDVAITAGSYQHVTEHMQADAAARIGSALLG
jgi:integrase